MLIMNPYVVHGKVNGSRVGRPQLETFLPNVTEFTLRLPDKATRYKFHLSALTQVGAGEEFAGESPHFANEGEFLHLSLMLDHVFDQWN